MFQLLIPLLVVAKKYPTKESVACGETIYSQFEKSNILKMRSGKLVDIEEFPWHVNIFDQGRHLCGGSILNEWWVLSASHCFINKNKSTLEVLHDDGKSSSKNTPKKKVDKLITHRYFDSLLLKNDIALLLLKSPFNLSDTRVPICLTEVTETEGWRNCYITTRLGDVHQELQKFNVKLVEQSMCSHTIPMITRNMLCAESPQGGKDACQGDSGGPLVCQKQDQNIWYQLGISSWEVGCNQKNVLLVYTKVSLYLLWIFEETTMAGKTFIPEPDSGYSLLLSLWAILLLCFVMLLLTP